MCLIYSAVFLNLIAEKVNIYIYILIRYVNGRET